MIPELLTALMEEKGVLEAQPAGQIFHSQDFADAMFMLKSGYVKRYQVTKEDNKVIELIYGPSHVFPLSQLYKRIFGVEQNQQDLVYVYQAMTEIEIRRLDDDEIMAALEQNPRLYEDLFYEAGLRLKSNIDRLASNALKDDYKKVAHQLVCLANEFGTAINYEDKEVLRIDVPLTPTDMAEQLNISAEGAEAIMNSLSGSNLLIIGEDASLMLPDIDLLKDVYL